MLSRPWKPNASSPAQRDVSLRLLPNNFLHDQENIWLFPGRLARGRHWSPTIAVVAATAGLLTADPYVQPYFDHTTAFRRLDRAFASKLTGEETIAIPAALYLVGLGNRDSYMQKTALFAGEAVLDSEAVRMAINSVTTRWRPSDVARQAIYGGHFLPRQRSRGQQLSFRAYDRRCFDRYRRRAPLSRSSLGRVGRLRLGGNHRLFAD